MIPDNLTHGIEVVAKLVIVEATLEYLNLLFSGSKFVSKSYLTFIKIGV